MRRDDNEGPRASGDGAPRPGEKAEKRLWYNTLVVGPGVKKPDRIPWVRPMPAQAALVEPFRRLADEWSFLGGDTHALAPGPSGLRWTVPTRGPSVGTLVWEQAYFADFSLSVVAAFGGGRGRQQVRLGVGFRARSDMTGFCRLALDGAGTLRLSQRVNDARTVLIEEHAAPGFARGADADNALRLEVVGPSISLFVNEHAVGRVSDAALTTGLVFLFVQYDGHADAGAQDVLFKDLIVTPRG